jgi:hypothetical protein
MRHHLIPRLSSTVGHSSMADHSSTADRSSMAGRSSAIRITIGEIGA